MLHWRLVEMKKIRDTLNDGFLKYGTKKTTRSERGKNIGGQFTEVGNLAYQEMSCRDSDYELAKVMTKVLDLKVKTLYPPSLLKEDKSKFIILIDDIEYDVIKVDADREKRYLYFYLQRVG